MMTRAGLISLGMLLFTAGCSNGQAEEADGAPDDDAAPVDAGLADAETDSGEAGTEETTEDLLDIDCPDPSVLVKAIRERAQKLVERSRALDEREHSLKQLEKAIDTRLTNLEKAKELATTEVDRLAEVRAGVCREAEEECTQKIAKLKLDYSELETGLANWDKAQQQRSTENRDAEVLRLTKALSTMRPEVAAATLSALDSDTAALLISQIPERSSGKILAALEPAKTANIVETLLEKASATERDALREVAQNATAESDEDSDEANEEEAP